MSNSGYYKRRMLNNKLQKKL